MSLFQVSISFDISPSVRGRGGKIIDNTCIDTFWAAAQDYQARHGCYVFSLRAGKGARPWYVGKASMLTLGKEAFSLHKREIYNTIIGDHAGTPMMTFVVPASGKGKTPHLMIDEIEEYLIGHAASRNVNLANKRKLPSQKWTIQGVVPAAQGKPAATAAAFKTLMGIQKRPRSLSSAP
jgi:hypothetical protein